MSYFVKLAEDLLESNKDNKELLLILVSDLYRSGWYGEGQALSIIRALENPESEARGLEALKQSLEKFISKGEEAKDYLDKINNLYP